MAKNLNPQDVANKWLNGMSNATKSYSDGVNSVSVAPGQLAAQASQKYLTGVQNSVSSGTYAQNCANVSLQSWQQSATQKGAARLASGASQAKGKVTNFLSQFIPALQSAQSQVNSMPSDTYEQRKAKSGAMQDALHSLKGKFKQ